MSAHARTADPKFTGKMVGVRRRAGTDHYDAEFFAVDADKVANYVKNFPVEWLQPDYKGITQEAVDYMLPLIQGNPVILYDENGLPAYVTPYYMRDEK